jgi:hypothetical protein
MIFKKMDSPQPNKLPMKKIGIVIAIALLLIGLVVTAVVLSTRTVDKCKKNNIVCQNGGTCVDGECECATGYTGDLCETRRSTPSSTPSSTCDSSKCQNGTCKDDKCKCNTGYTGTLCQTRSPNCTASTCGNGTCQSDSCVCNTGYNGVPCTRNVPKTLEERVIKAGITIGEAAKEVAVSASNEAVSANLRAYGSEIFTNMKDVADPSVMLFSRNKLSTNLVDHEIIKTKLIGSRDKFMTYLKELEDLKNSDGLTEDQKKKIQSPQDVLYTAIQNVKKEIANADYYMIMTRAKLAEWTVYLKNSGLE